jgi:hypothetical protein
MRTFNGVNYNAIAYTPGLTKVRVETQLGPGDSGSVTVFVAVPEPGTLALGVAGVVSLLALSRLRRRHSRSSASN